MKTVLVTGAAGFIAPHVGKRLASAGWNVRFFDNRELPVDGDLVKGDLTSMENCLHATDGVDAICHLGGVGDVYLALEQPWTAASANVLGTANLVEAALRNGVDRFVYASTWEVYGEPQYQPIDEQHPCCPDHPYSITKLAGERLALSYDPLKGLNVTGLRLGTAYGVGMRANSVFSLFIGQATRGEPIRIFGNGAQTRQFTHVRDIADGFAKTLESETRGEVFNIVSPEVISIKELALAIVDRIPSRIEYQDPRAGDPPVARVSSDKAQRLLGWSATVPFALGLQELIDVQVNSLSTDQGSTVVT